MIKFKEVIEIYRQEVEPFMYRLTVGLPILFIILTTWNYLIIIHICNIRLFTLQVDLLLYLLVFNVFSSILIWFFSFRKQKKFKGDEVGILIALTKLDEKTDEDLTKLYKHLEHLINTKNFRSRVMVRMIPTHLIPKKESEAHKLREKINAQLIVWGNVDKGKNLSESQTVFIPIYFSYQLCLPLDKAVVIKNSFDHVIANRKWIISENNNIFDREYVARNLEEVSLYMISAVLFFAQRKDEALEIIKNVLDKYQVKTTLTYDDNIAIINIKILRFEIFRRENIKLKFGPLVKAGAKEKNIKIAEELITNEKNNGEPELSLLLEAQVEFARRDIHKAILRAKEACVLSKDISPACFTLAFLYFYKEDLITGWHWLKKAVTKSPKYEMMVQMPGILGWYEDALIENNEKYCLHFPLGVIYYKYMKEFKNSKESLELFLEKYQDASDRDMRPLIIEAEKILKKIRKLNG